VFFFVFVIMLGVHFFGVYKLSVKLQYLHPLVKVFAFVLICEFLGIFANLIHYGSFASNGVGVPVLNKSGDVLDVVARITFILLLMLLAKGWTISGDKLTHRKAIVGAVVAFTIAYIFILFWQFAAESDASVENPKALQVMLVILIVIWMGFAIWFLVAAFQSWRGEDNPVKKGFYLKLGLLYGVWFLGLPFVNFLVFALDPWVREKIVKSISLLITTAAYTVLVFLLWPSRAEEYFDISTPDITKQSIDNYEQL